MLRIVRPDGTAVSVGADVSRTVIGSGAASGVHVESPYVSEAHAALVAHESGYALRDLRSGAGTRVRRGGAERDLDRGGAPFPLVDGDVVVLGPSGSGVELRVELVDEDASVVATRSRAELPTIEARTTDDRETFRTLYEGLKQLSVATDLDDVLRAVSDQVFTVLSRATHVTVALREEDEDGAVRYVPIGSREKSAASKTAPIAITRGVFRKVVETRSAVLAADARSEVGSSASMLAAQIISTIGVPLWDGDDLAGVLQVDNRARPGMFSERDLDLLLVVGQSASMAFARARLLARLRYAEERSRNENSFLKRREQSRRFEGLIGEAPSMRRVLEQIRKVADTRVSVLVLGETGTGKEMAASAVHYWSNRRDKLFIAQNCAALPENLLESELFGHRRGAFTGATEDKKGLFELAHEGTLFLDEIGEMPLSLQAKLLRVLQDGEIRAVGANQTRRVDVRIVAATNRDLEAEVKAGRFREDLYYRLGVFPIRLPPLRERREDVPILAGHFLTRYSADFGREVAGFSQQAMELLQGYEWPGNVRELQNEVQRLILQVDDGMFVEPEDLSPRIRKAENVIARVRPEKGTLKEMVEQVERWILAEALREHDHNKSATAKTLGITREGLHKKLRGYNMT